MPPASQHRRTPLRISVAGVLLAWVALMGMVHAANQPDQPVQGIRIPYGMSWGDTTEKVRDMIKGVKGKEVSFLTKSPGKDVLEAEGLGVGDTLLKKTVFTFRDGSLVEIELEYRDEGWEEDKAVDFFDRTRRNINGRYGVGTLLVNRIKEHPAGEKDADDKTYTLIVYSWSQPTAVLELDYYSFKEEEKELRLVSLHYKMP